MLKGEQPRSEPVGREFLFEDHRGVDWHVYFTEDFSGTIRFHTADEPAIQIPYEIIRQVAATIVRLRKFADINAADDGDLLK